MDCSLKEDILKRMLLDPVEEVQEVAKEALSKREVTK